MKKLNCLIIDDEPIAREGIENYCNKVPFLKVIATCKNVMQANHYLKIHQIDLIFLDINMPLQSGLEWLKELKNSPSIIMTTAYAEYALESYTYNVLDYLVKPISFQRFQKAVKKVSTYFLDEKEANVVFLKSEKQLNKVKLSDVLFIEAMQNYVKVVTDHKTIIAHMSLKSIIEILPEKDFIQTHKSYVISKYRVDNIIDNQIIINNYVIPISVRLKSKILKMF